MFCSNCGAQMPDNVKYCNNCGAPMPTSFNPVSEAQSAFQHQAASQPVQPVYPTQPQATFNTTSNTTPAGAKKKAPANKTTIIIVVVVVALLGSLIGKFVIAPSMIPDKNDETVTIQQNATPNPAYKDVFLDAAIVHFQPFFGLDTASYVMIGDNGIIYCADYGYQIDSIKQWVETIYIPVRGFSDAQKAEIERVARSDNGSFDTISCCSVTYTMGNNYLTVKITFSNVDQKSNYSELYAAGILQENAAPSMVLTEKSRLDEGFIKE